MKKFYDSTNMSEIYGKHVRIYFNLHKKCWSIMDKKTRLVIGYSNNIKLKNCKYIVSKTGREKVLREKRKNVHAFVEGYICDRFFSDEPIKKLAYNPYRYESFVDSETKQPLFNAYKTSLICINKKPRQFYWGNCG